VREPGSTGEVPDHRAARWIALQQTTVKQDYFIWENMTYLARPTFAIEEAKD
jgi:hypothetical protein